MREIPRRPLRWRTPGARQRPGHSPPPASHRRPLRRSLAGRGISGGERIGVAVYLRWNQKPGITLAAMRRYRSQDFGAGDVVVRDAQGFGHFVPQRMPGICATQDPSYIASLVYQAGETMVGEVLTMEASDTGARCMDGQPVVRPRKILSRTPCAAWMAANGVREWAD